MTGDDLYISDLHLSPATPERNALFKRFLSHHCEGAHSLTIVGDFFNAYAGYKQLAYAFYRDLCLALSGLAKRGVEIHFVAGNRDFLFTRDAKRFGIAGHDEWCTRQCGTIRVIAHHGDAFCLNDRAHLRYRAVMRRLPLHFINHITPAWFGQWVVGGMRRSSQNRKERYAAEPNDRWDIQNRATIPFIRETGCDILICGHIHRPQERLYYFGTRAARMLVLGEWDGGSAIMAVGRGSDVQLCRLTLDALVPWPHELASGSGEAKS